MEKVLRLPPGFRFHPTDEELVEYYLRRKAFRCPLPASIIPDIDLSEDQPWDIPGDGNAGFLEKERYFFARVVDKHRSASCGYWKPTGKECKIAASHGDGVVGVKKVLAFYKGRPSCWSRTDWVMHEYRLADAPVLQTERWVLCRVFRKRRRATRGKRISGNNMAMPIGAQGSWDSESSCLTELSEESNSDKEDDKEDACADSSGLVWP